MQLMPRVKKAVAAFRSPLWLRALRLGVGAGIEHEQVLHKLGCRTVVDIGANRGQFALVARHCFPDATIISFEPLHGPSGIFQKVFAGDSKVELHRAAIGPEAGNTTIHVSRRDDSSSLLPISALQNQIFPGTQETGTETIRVGRLEDFIPAERLQPPALLKLDVQGYELSALKGCETLLQHFAYVYAECSFVELYAGQALADEVIAWLRERSFILCGVYNMAYDRDGKAVQADFLFKRAAKPEV